jgi:hypothetical protein
MIPDGEPTAQYTNGSSCCLSPALRNAERDETGYIYSYNVAWIYKQNHQIHVAQLGVSMAARSRAKKRYPQYVYGLPVPEGLYEAIEIQRDNLARAESVLGCLVASMEYDSDSANRPYYPDVAQLARELVRQSINGLDSLALQQHLLRNKVREHRGLISVEGAYPALLH